MEPFYFVCTSCTVLNMCSFDIFRVRGKSWFLSVSLWYSCSMWFVFTGGTKMMSLYTHWSCFLQRQSHHFGMQYSSSWWMVNTWTPCSIDIFKPIFICMLEYHHAHSRWMLGFLLKISFILPIMSLDFVFPHDKSWEKSEIEETLS